MARFELARFGRQAIVQPLCHDHQKTLLTRNKNVSLKLKTKEWEPWSSGYGRRLMFPSLWVQIPAPYTGWTFFHIYLL